MSPSERAEKNAFLMVGVMLGASLAMAAEKTEAESQEACVERNWALSTTETGVFKVSVESIVPAF